MTEAEIVELIMSVGDPLAAELALEEVRFWLDQPEISDAARRRVMYQAESLVLMADPLPLDPPD